MKTAPRVTEGDVAEKITSLAKRRGFVFPSSEIYGGAGATWDFGPLGVELTPPSELVGGMRQRLRMPGHAARRSPYAFRDDAHFAEMAREEDKDAIRLGEVVRL